MDTFWTPNTNLIGHVIYVFLLVNAGRWSSPRQFHYSDQKPHQVTSSSEPSLAQHQIAQSVVGEGLLRLSRDGIVLCHAEASAD